MIHQLEKLPQPSGDVRITDDISGVPPVPGVIDLREHSDPIYTQKARLAARDLLTLIDPESPHGQQVADQQVVRELAWNLYGGAVQTILDEAAIENAKARHPSHVTIDEGDVRRLEEYEQERQQAAQRMERGGYAEIAPSFKDQIEDESRTTPFTYNNLPPHVATDGRQEKVTTEIQGLRDLDEFLDLFLATTDRPNGTYLFEQEAKQAQSLIDNLTFIGEREYQTAADGLVTMWKAYLDADPSRKICIITGASNSQKYLGTRKSDAHLKAHMLRRFSDQELEEYAGRIVDSPEAIQADSHDKVRVILLDDWTISGSQMHRAYSELIRNPRFRKFANSVEVNLLAASKDRIYNGIADPDDPHKKHLPVRAYYMAHPVSKSIAKYGAHIAGLHSTVNFDFGDTIEKIVKRMESIGIPRSLPALASIVRAYRGQKPNEYERLRVDS